MKTYNVRYEDGFGYLGQATTLVVQVEAASAREARTKVSGKIIRVWLAK